MTRGKIYWTKNDEITKNDKKTADYLNEFCSSTVENLDIKRYETGCDSVVDNTADPTLKVILKYRKHPIIIAINGRYKGKHPFNINKVQVDVWSAKITRTVFWSPFSNLSFNFWREFIFFISDRIIS